MEITISKQWLEEYAQQLDVEVRTDYSGRFMYGRECVGIVGGPSDLAKFLINLRDAVTQDIDDEGAALDVWEDQYEVWENVRWDNMGSNLIFYWPSVQVRD